MTDWRPCSGPEAAASRAALLRRIREYFASRKVLEVHTPTLGTLLTWLRPTSRLSICTSLTAAMPSVGVSTSSTSQLAKYSRMRPSRAARLAAASGPEHGRQSVIPSCP